MKKLVYIASPFKALAKEKNIEEVALFDKAIREAIKGARVVKNAGFIPLSPILNFAPLFDEEKERKEVLEAGLELLRCCDYIYVHKCKGWESSRGIQKELRFAEKNCILELEIENLATINLKEVDMPLEEIEILNI